MIRAFVAAVALAAAVAGVAAAAPLDARCDKRVALMDQRLSAVVADEDDLKGLRIAATLPQASPRCVAGAAGLGDRRSRTASRPSTAPP